MIGEIDCLRDELEDAKSVGNGLGDQLQRCIHAYKQLDERARSSVPEECPHLIMFDDQERENLVFAGKGARDSALKAWQKISNSWNAHLFVRIGSNTSDDPYPSAQLIEPRL